ncbi:MAG: putative negative regulator of RcsB-dependent stress response [Arenicella sp.]|jgi:predicted negative regulator of RcsB-dependent stress response
MLGPQWPLVLNIWIFFSICFVKEGIKLINFLQFEQKKLFLHLLFRIIMAKNDKINTEVKDELTGTESFFDKYKNYFFIGGGAIVIIVLGVFGYQKFVSEPKAIDSQDAYWNAFYEYQKGDSTNVAYDGNENFEGFESVAEEYDGTPGGEIANYGMATHMMDEGDWDGALGYLDECDFEDVMLGTLVIGMKGDCHVEKGEMDKAAEFFEQAAQREENEFTTPMFLKKAGLVYENQGDLAAATAAYEKIKMDWSASKEAADIDKYIARVQ